MSRIVLVNQSSTPDDDGSGNAQLFIEGNELYQQVGTGDKSKVVNQTTSTFTSPLSVPSVSAVNTCKAWARWDGTGGGHAEVAGATFNVSSIAYNGTGNYTVNLTIPLAFGSGGCVVGSAGDSNYSSADTNLNFRHDVSSNSTIDVIIATDGGADHSDCDQISMAVFN